MKSSNALVLLCAGIIGLASCKKDIQSSANNSKTLEKSNIQGAVYLIDNATSENHVVVYGRSSSGHLTSSGNFATGGKGTGSGLGSQGAVILDNSGQYLFAVNAGSNDITSFRISGNELRPIDKISSGGTTPISLTIHENVLYVLNSGGTGNIHGFYVNEGNITDISGSTQSLSSGAAGPAEIQFNSDGTALVVTEKNNNMIDVYPVSNGLAGIRKSYPSVGVTPFGFALGKNDEFYISNASGGMAGQSTLTSFSLDALNDLHLISGPIATTQTSACWVAVTNNGKYAYTANTGSASISLFSISNDGTATLIKAASGNTGTSPADLALSNNSHFLYSRNGASGSISMFEIGASGDLTSLGTVTGLPSGTAGLAAR